MSWLHDHKLQHLPKERMMQHLTETAAETSSHISEFATCPCALKLLPSSERSDCGTCNYVVPAQVLRRSTSCSNFSTSGASYSAVYRARMRSTLQFQPLERCCVWQISMLNRKPAPRIHQLQVVDGNFWCREGTHTCGETQRKPQFGYNTNPGHGSLT